MKRRIRTRYEMIADILKCCVEWANKTNIGYCAKVPWARLNGYLTLLVKKGWLVESSGKYKTTAEGRTVERQIREVFEALYSMEEP